MGFSRWGKDLFCFFACALALTTLLGIVSLAQYSAVSDTDVKGVAARLTSSLDSHINLADKSQYAGLPVGEVKSYPVANAAGTVIYIPQYHRSPDANVEETFTKSAEKTQNQLHQILSFLLDKARVGFVMMEGQLYGEVPQSKVNTVAQELKEKDILAKDYQSLKESLDSKHKGHFDKSAKEAVLNGVNQELAKMDQDIILHGAPLALAAEGKNFLLFGSENEGTYKESANIVENYLAIKERLSQVQNLSYNRQTQNLFTLPNEATLNFFSKLLSGNSLASSFLILEEQAREIGDNDLAGLITTIKERLDQVGGDKQNQALMKLTNPQTQENPYRRVSSQSQLQNMLADAESQIEEVVVKRRNRETAENMAQALKTENKDVGIIQYGAGHEEGLIKELNNQNLSVIVVKANEVSQRNEQIMRAAN